MPRAVKIICLILVVCSAFVAVVAFVFEAGKAQGEITQVKETSVCDYHSYLSPEYASEQGWWLPATSKTTLTNGITIIVDYTSTSQYLNQGSKPLGVKDIK